MGIQINAGFLCQHQGILVGGKADGQHHHVKYFLCQVSGFSGIHQPVPVTWFRKLLAMGTHVHIEDGAVQVIICMLLGNHRLFGGIHAAHPGTVGIIPFVDVS